MRFRRFFFAGASYLDIIDMHGVHQSTFYSAVEETVAAINNTNDYDITFPWGDVAELEKMSQEFFHLNNESLENCVLAVDGIAIKIAKPTQLDTPNPSHYYSRKGFFALNVQAGVDAHLRIRFLSVATVGSTHDSLAFALSEFATKLNNGELPYPFYIVGDDAYTGTDSMVTPWPGRNLPTDKDAFNFFQSRSAPRRPSSSPPPRPRPCLTVPFPRVHSPARASPSSARLACWSRGSASCGVRFAAD